MTLIIELEQRFESVAQVDRRAHGSWCSLSNAWKIEAHKQVAEEEESFRGRPHRDAIGVSIAVIMAWGLWKSLASALLYMEVSRFGAPLHPKP